jgi:FtsH-binding integral membrane protein
MDLRRLRAGEWITALGGAILLVALFIPWYDEGAVDPTGWQAFTVTDGILALVAIAALLVAVVTAQQRTPAVPLAMEAFVALAGLIAVILTVIRLLNLPGDAGGREIGVWLGLLGALVTFVGSGLAMRDERRSEGGRHFDLTGRPTPPPAEIEVVPAPRSDP